MSTHVQKLATVFALSLAAMIGIAILLGGSAGLFAFLIWAIPPAKALVYVAPAIVAAGVIAFGGAVLLFRFLRSEIVSLRGTQSAPSSAFVIVLGIALVFGAGYLVYDYPYYFYSQWTYHYPPKAWTTYSSEEGYSIDIPTTWRTSRTYSDYPMVNTLGPDPDAGSIFLKSTPVCFTPLACPVQLDDMVVQIKIEKRNGQSIEQWLKTQSDIVEWRSDYLNGKPIIWATSEKNPLYPATNAIFFNNTKIARIHWINNEGYKKPLLNHITGTFAFFSES